jgi:S-(hydroxymethyl)glutathione dehydrogenase/alcohol dehydrogenase
VPTHLPQALDDEGDEEVTAPVNTRGAIMPLSPGKWEVVDLVSDDPRPGELQVKLAASGMCHSDDHVVFAFLPACGKCRWCASGLSYLCDLGAGLPVGARFDDPQSFRITTPDGTPVGQMCGIGTFAEVTTVHVESAVKIDDDIPLEVACLTGNIRGVIIHN